MGERSKRSDQKRKQIRKAAYHMFRANGFHDTTVDAICKAADTSKGSFYWHYDSKQDVFIDILSTWARQVMDELYEQFEHAVHEPDYLLATARALEREISRGRAVVPFWLQFSVQAPRDPQLREALGKFYRRARAAIAEILRPLTDHRLTEAELQGAAAGILGGYIGLLIQEFSDPGNVDAVGLMRQFMSAVRWQFDSEDSTQNASTKGPKVIGEASAELPGDVAAFLDGQSPDVLALTLELRTLLLNTVPTAREHVIHGWKVIGYDGAKLTAYIKPRPGAVHLGFYHGVNLADPGGLLQGSGKRRRHAVIAVGAPLDGAPLAALIRQAFDT